MEREVEKSFLGEGCRDCGCVDGSLRGGGGREGQDVPGSVAERFRILDDDICAVHDEKPIWRARLWYRLCRRALVLIKKVPDNGPVPAESEPVDVNHGQHTTKGCREVSGGSGGITGGAGVQSTGFLCVILRV